MIFFFLCSGKILGVELRPRSIEAIEFGAGCRKKREPFQPLVMGEKGEHLFFELRPSAAGDDGDVDSSE
jgi:hypothetical protein